ncbi:type 4 pilus major pilin [Bordetella hinzii]|uniref:type 4 pilus major pilin n=1 Tax=Bordetella hinzii TaxID=103855 RepID=UPI00045B49C4|nr:type 4 pilus major pilin [Bordetella hinzii]KCB30310.1 prepilin-type cleavage/methylation N-terminal domain protein [Bordetella hinzii CA90 BAL1384]KCB39850.1 prepilin-type cleavage/methylation N-terminal domain protein [Bordetella hinzii 5132]QWF37844.1 prepilin-type N-terminal cleavage/methylation domain-containing protein [Bordetella hinzii]QWF42389.1 prepilin-type N-terminal cleavage/methylation domain-containing protein [Bordetella hinzii]QWF46931.1 prepilin-type N-terminal cleavage/me
MRHVLRPRGSREQGFSLIEISVVAAVLLIVAVIGVPAIEAYVVESRVPKLAEALQRFVVRARIAGMGGSAPYAGMDTAFLAEAMRESGVLSVSGQGAAATVRHGLGEGGITMASGSRPGEAAGSAFTLTLDRVHAAACPGLAAAMQGLASRVSVQGKGEAVLVKNAEASPVLAYDGSRASAQCAARNTFVFTFP